MSNDAVVISIVGFPYVQAVPAEALRLLTVIYSPAPLKERQKAGKQLDKLGFPAGGNGLVRLRALHDVIDAPHSFCGAICKDITAESIMVPESLMDAAAVVPLDVTKGFDDAVLAAKAAAIKAAGNGRSS